MRKKWLVIPLVLGLALLFVPKTQQSTITPNQEIRSKEALVIQDMMITDGLCRQECTLDFKEALDQSKTIDKTNLLQDLQKNHPHMVQLYWTSRNKPLEQSLSVGNNHFNDDPAQEMLKKAKQETDLGKEFLSPSFSSGSDLYFVLGIPSSADNDALIGVIHQNILTHVQQHQINNLRLSPYQEQGKWKVKAVDSVTLKNKEVHHPEDLEGTSHYVEREVVVKFATPPTNAELQLFREEAQAEIIQTLGHTTLGHTYIFKSSTLETKELMNYFHKLKVEYAEPHFLYMTNETDVEPTPNDLLYSRYQWNLPIIDTTEGWKVSRGTSNVVVAVVDTGVDLNHPDLENRIIPGTNVVDPSSTPQDDVGHGTHVAGIISAVVNNQEGIAGMTWYSPILPVKVLDSSGSGSTYAVAQGIIWAADHGAKVINLSLGNYADAEFLHDAIRYAFNKDIVLIAASGNDNTDQPGYPAAYPEVFAVAATDSNKKKASFSNYGDYIDVAAPGVSIASTYPHKQYAALSGTSMASPHVAALAALIRSANPQLTNLQVMDIMRTSAVDLGERGKDPEFGYGQIDVTKALQQSMNGDKDIKHISQSEEQSKQTEEKSQSIWYDWLRRTFERLQK